MSYHLLNPLIYCGTSILEDVIIFLNAPVPLSIISSQFDLFFSSAIDITNVLGRHRKGLICIRRYDRRSPALRLTFCLCLFVRLQCSNHFIFISFSPKFSIYLVFQPPISFLFRKIYIHGISSTAKADNYRSASEHILRTGMFPTISPFLAPCSHSPSHSIESTDHLFYPWTLNPPYL